MKMIKSIPALPVHDIDAGTKFYEERFGFTCLIKKPGFSKLIRDDIEIHLWEAGDKKWKWKNLFLFLKPIHSGAETFIAGTHSCRIEVTDIHNFYDEFSKTRVLYNKTTEVEETHWGTKEFPTLDLHCNLLTFFERIR
ncbi:MAG: bleomycin resistance family protein [Pedobacter sp.]|nr:MAG: bleomycin resistance family protein [Pedobacter sp.]